MPTGLGTCTLSCQQRELNPELVQADPCLAPAPGARHLPLLEFTGEMRLSPSFPISSLQMQVCLMDSLLAPCWEAVRSERPHVVLPGWPQSPAWTCQPAASADPGLVWLCLQA